MTLDTFLQSELLQRVAWGLLHSIWQIALLAVIYACVSLILTARYARIRYLFGLATLLTMLLLPAVTMFLVDPVVIAVRENPREQPPIVVEIEPEETPDPPTKTTPIFSPESLHGEAFLDFAEVITRDEPETVVPAIPAIPAIPAAEKSFWREIEWIRFFPLLSGIWFFGVLVMFLRLCLEFWAIRRIKKHAFVIAEGTWEEILQKIAARFLIRRKILVRGSRRVNSPLLIGVFRPIVLIPLSMVSCLTPEEIEVILMHELGHVRRHDYLLNLVQIVLETLLFITRFYGGFRTRSVATVNTFVMTLWFQMDGSTRCFTPKP